MRYSRFTIPALSFTLSVLGIYGCYKLAQSVNELSSRFSKQQYDDESLFTADNVYLNLEKQLKINFNPDVLTTTLQKYPLHLENYNEICSKEIGEKGLSRIFIAERTDNKTELDLLVDKLSLLYGTNISIFSSGEIDDSGFIWVQTYTFPTPTFPNIGLIVNSETTRSKLMKITYETGNSSIFTNITTTNGEKGMVTSIPLTFDNASNMRKALGYQYNFKGYFEPQVAPFVLNHDKTNIEIKLNGDIVFGNNSRASDKLFEYDEISLEIRISEFNDSEEKNIFIFVFVPGILVTLFLVSLLVILDISRISAVTHSEYSSRFIADISHEILTPLNGILGISQILSETDLGTYNDFMKSIKSCGNSLLFILNNVIEKSNFDNNRFSLHESVVDIVKILMKCSEEAWRTYSSDKRDVDLLYIVENGIPIECISDEKRITQVFSNLLSNSIKFTKSGRITVRIWGNPENQNDCRINCEVRDTGIGMDKKTQKKLFTPFRRFDDDPNSTGTGVGLVVSKKISNVMGGDVYCVKSEPEIGTIFMYTYRVKCTEKNETHGSLTSLYRNNDVRRPSSFNSDDDDDIEKNSGIKVLIVDDVNLNRMILQRMISSLGIGYDSCSNGKEAVDLCRQVKYRVVFMDNMMPVMGGEEATVEIRKNSLNKETPIIFVSANVQPVVIDRCLKCGGNGFLSKPITKNAIVLALD